MTAQKPRYGEDATWGGESWPGDHEEGTRLIQLKNMNDLATEVCAREGKSVETNIAQVKEILRCVRELFCEKPLTMLKLFLNLKEDA